MIDRPIILGSGSPRRQYLMQGAGFTFTVEKTDADESFPDSLPVTDVAKYVAAKKAEHFRLQITNEIVVTADTVVLFNNTILNKPENRKEAIEMLSKLSGNTHTVITGVCIVSAEKEESFDDSTEVTFVNLSQAEIEYYVDTFKPYDKAGAYGAQDFIGMVGIEKIQGSFYNVMGLPIHQVYQHLVKW